MLAQGQDAARALQAAQQLLVRAQRQQAHVQVMLQLVHGGARHLRVDTLHLVQVFHHGSQLGRVRMDDGAAQRGRLHQ
ncbi:hypothetical protein D3C87_2061880 [compost metagenome]